MLFIFVFYKLYKETLNDDLSSALLPRFFNALYTLLHSYTVYFSKCHYMHFKCL